MIRVRNLEKRYGTVRAIEGVSFDVGSGEIVGLLGHNGAGKSTVMKIITGYLEPSEGSVEVEGTDVVEDRVAVQRKIGYLPESAPLYPEMLVQEYLLMVAELRGIAPEERDTAVATAARATSLGDWMLRPIGTLSKGYRQRVGLAQAIVHHPRVLVLDEPTNGLDPVQIIEIRGLIRKLAASSTVILSTHILSEIEAVCDRVVILIDGVVAADSRLSELLESNSVRLSVEQAADGVAQRLGKIDGVESVTKLGSDPAHDGYDIWTLTCNSSRPPTSKVVRAAAKAGWEVASIGTDTTNLEQIFRDLMTAHVSRATAGVAA